jgi:hypothetical protein
MRKMNPARQEAIANNQVMYSTGKPCKYGHIAPRYTKTHACSVCNKALAKAWNKKHPEKTLAAGRRSYARDPSKAAARYAKRRAAKQKATPVWLSKDDVFLMQEIYSLARLRTKISKTAWEVDHIVPLSNPKVCGLHVPWNLQVIPLIENRKKRNILT